MSSANAAALPADAPARCRQSEFAQLMGWSKGYVTDLKKAGRLVMLDDGLVDVQASVERLRATAQAPERAAPVVQGISFSNAQDRERFYNAELKRLEYEREIGQLLQADEVASAVRDAGAMIRSTIEAWRDRLPPQLAALGADEQRAAALMAAECEALLQAISDRLGQLAAGQPPMAKAA